MDEIILTTMCAVFDSAGRVACINRKKSWPGYAFPGGHVERGEGITDCVIREVWEETGLRIADPEFRGMAHFYDQDTHERYLVFNYACRRFEGELRPEGPNEEVRWVAVGELAHLPLAEGMEERLPLFLDGDRPGELFVEWNRSGHRKAAVQRI